MFEKGHPFLVMPLLKLHYTKNRLVGRQNQYAIVWSDVPLGFI